MSYACSEYVENYLLAASEAPLVLVIDELDTLFGYPELATDFFGLVRSWYEQGRYGLENRSIWHRFHMAIIHSTEVWLPLNLNQSPFNVGLLLELPAFQRDQMLELVRRYGLEPAEEYAHELLMLLGGHPFLSQLCLFHLSNHQGSLASFVQNAVAPDSIFSSYLQRLLKILEEQNLMVSMSALARSPNGLELPHSTALRLQGLGLVTFKKGMAFPSCELFRRFFITL